MRPLLFLALLCSIKANGQMPDTVSFYFEKGTTRLLPPSLTQLEFVKQQLHLKQVKSLVIHGHADASGESEANQLLSQQRAAAIAMQLQSSLVDTVLISIRAFGEDSLLTTDPQQPQLNRRVTVWIEWAPVIVQLQPFTEDVAEQIFEVNLDDTIGIRAKEGTLIRIPPGALQTKAGKAVKGRAQIRIKEYYQTADILLAGMHTSSDKGLLQTGGMVKISIVQGGDTLSDRMRKKVIINMPLADTGFADMKVFRMQAMDSTGNGQWQNSGTSFTRRSAFWWWMTNDRISESVFYRYSYYQGLKPGSRYKEDYHHSKIVSVIPWVTTHTKYIEQQIQKIDSSTVSIRLHLKYRRKGWRKFGLWSLDTTVLLRHVEASYQAFVNNLSFINCDRFLKYKNKVQFLVETPGYTGLQVMAYCKKLRAFLPAMAMNNQYLLDGVPKEMPVVLVAIGKKDGQLYFGKADFVTREGVIPKIPLQQVTKEVMQKALRTL